nr:hypothetical protein [uncultured Porphyromonas sp.]
MTITIKRTSLPDLVVTPESSSYRYRKIAGEHAVHLSFVLERYEDLPLGSYLDYQGQRYRLWRLPEVTKVNEQHWRYTLTMEPPQGLLSSVLMKHRTDGRTVFPLTASPREHLRMLVDAANAALPEGSEQFSIAACVDAEPRLIHWRQHDLQSALQLLSETFATEWAVEGAAVTLGRLERGKDDPIQLSYGKGNGLRSGVKRQSAEGYTAPKRLYVSGGDRNIVHARYGAKSLGLVRGLIIRWDGSKFEGETGFSAASARTYRTSNDGSYLERTDLVTGAEIAYSNSDIYPKRVGSVTSVREDSAATDKRHALYSIVDSSIPAALDYTKSLIAGQDLEVAFQTGMLAGQRFGARYDHTAKRFSLVGREVDGVWMPEAPYLPKAGDKYIVLGVELPEAYIRDHSGRTGAEWELLRAALRHLDEQYSDPYTWRADLDGKWASEDWLNRGGRLQLGSYVKLVDRHLAPTGVSLRIIGIKDYLYDPTAPELELGTKAAGSSVITRLEQAASAAEQRLEDTDGKLRETSRSLAQGLETSRLLAQEAGDRFTREISPVAVQTMQLLLGDQRTQLRFVSPSPWQPVWNKMRSVVVLPEGVIEHQTLGLPATISSAEPTRKRWTLSRLESPHLGEAGKPYYIYAQVPKSGDRGAYRIEEQHLAFETSTHYNLLLGTLSSADASGSRSFARLYGFTEVLPGQMRTERIASPDGTFVIDLVSKQIITPSLRFSSGGKTVQEIIREGDKTALEGAKNYAEGKAREAKTYADEKAEEAKRWNIHTHTFDLTQLDPNKYYAAVIHLTGTKGIPYKQPARFEIALYAGLDPSVAKPPYATHPHGFFLDLRWSVNASGYGGRKENRVITHYDKLSVLQGEEVVSAPKQLIALSAEYVYLRGGGRYLVSVKSDVAPAFALATERWTVKGYETHGIPSPVDSIMPPKSDTDRLRDEMREGDKATLEGAKNAAQRYFDSGKAEILRGLDATARGLVERITGADNRLTDAERKLGETQQQLAQSKEQLAGQLTASIAQLEARNAELQRQVDKQVQSFFGVNPPTSRIDWPASDDAKHEGDTYTCVPPEGVTITSANASQYPNVGKSWRFTRGGWLQIADTDTTRALALAGQAKAAADGKVTHYRGSSVPTGYKAGDLWTLTADWTTYKRGAILTATRDYVSGQYNPSHWREEVRYTDDSAVRDLQLGGVQLLRAPWSTDERVQDGGLYEVKLTDKSGKAFELPAGTYTLSGDMEVKRKGDGLLLIPTPHPEYFKDHQDEWARTRIFPEDGRIVLTFTTRRAFNGFFLYPNYNWLKPGTAGHVVWRRLKLERGNKPTDWTPAPEDVDANIEAKAKEAKDHADANLAKANTHTDNAVSALERKQVTTAEELKSLSEAQAADRARLNTTSDTAAKAKEIAEAAKKGLGSLDYLARAIKDGESTVSGGVVLANILAAKELGTGAVRSFIAGEIYNERTKRLYPAFAAGVTGFGTASERRVVEINHDGTGHFGAMSVEQGGQIIRFYPTMGTGGQVLRIGGYQPSLDEIISSRPYSATLSHSGGFARRDVLRDNIDDLWRSQSFEAPAGAIISYRFSVRDLKCYFERRAAAPELSGQEVWTAEPSWAGSLYLRISIYKEGDASQVPVAREVQIVGANGVILGRKQDANFNAISFLAPSNGRYYAKLDIDRGNYGEVGSTHYGEPPEDIRWVCELSVNNATGSVAKTATSIQETVISDKGITILKSAKRFVVISPYESDDKPVLSVRGKIDIPGVLLAAQVKVNGYRVERVVSKWGTLADALRIERIGVGRWRITHNLGHADYSVHASAHSNGYGGIYVQEQRTHSFELVTSDRSDPADGLSFSVLVFGDPK